MDKRPNILLIMTDQQYAGAMSCAGNQELSTPGMDSISRNGIQFCNAYCTYPLCVPSRESIFTGRMPIDTGYAKWNDKIDDNIEQMGLLFLQAGYECVFGGKLHTPGWDAQAAEEHGFKFICGMSDNKLADACIKFLQEEHEKPFLMIASFDNPHNICEWARSQNLPHGNIADVPTESCPNLPANFNIPPYEPEVLRIIQRNCPTVYLQSYQDEDHWRHYRHAYYRLVEKVDAEIQKIINAVKEYGLFEDTLIAFTSDHGDGHGAHRWNQKSILYEECIKIPLILCYGSKNTQTENKDWHLVSNGLNLLPTFCDYAGIHTRDQLPGRSLRPILEGRPADEWDDQIIVETWPFQGDPGKTLGRVVRTEKYKYIIYNWGRYREQLFDMETDYGEMINLAVNDKYANILNDHRNRLRKWCRERKDKFEMFIPR